MRKFKGFRDIIYERDVMDRKEWKEAFKKHRNDLMERKKEIEDTLHENQEGIIEMGEKLSRGDELLKKMDVLLKDGKSQELNKIDEEYNKFENDIGMCAKFLKEITEELIDIDSELSKKVEKCPECNGSGDKMTWEWITIGEREEQVSHTEKCEVCDGRGEAPVSELLDS